MTGIVKPGVGGAKARAVWKLCEAESCLGRLHSVALLGKAGRVEPGLLSPEGKVTKEDPDG
jgi:hypothetical protein